MEINWRKSLVVLNGVKEGDEDKEFTCICNPVADEEAETFKLGERIDSDHML